MQSDNQHGRNLVHHARGPSLRKKLVVSGFLLTPILLIVVVFWWPSTSYDVNKVHSQLRELEAPYRSVGTRYYLDGGSIGIRIIDKNGRKLELALPIGDSASQPYPALFVGALHGNKPGAEKAEFTADTRNMLIAIIEQYDQSEFSVMSELRGWPRDYAKAYWRALAREVQRLFGK